MRSLLATILVVAAAVSGGAGEPTLEVSLDPQRIGVEDLTRLTVRVFDPADQRPSADLGPLVNFEVVQGPSTETQFSWVNGRATSAIGLSWILRPLAPGGAAVGPLTVRVGQSVLTAPAVTAEVIPGTLQRPRQRVRSPFGVSDPFAELFGGSRRPSRPIKVGLRHLVERSRIFEGQTVVVSVVLDTTGGSVDGFEWIQPPEYPGWWVQRVEMPERVEATQVEVEGEVYNRFEIGRFVLIPLDTGSLTIPAASARIGFRGRSVFTPQSVLERSTGDIVMEVVQRPAVPAGFTGAVGDLRYSVAIEPSTIAYGDSAVVTITLEGQGNLPLVQGPAEWPVCADCETYPPEEENSFVVDANGIRGSRSWRTTLLPSTWGELLLEPVEFAVFDPAAGSYRYRTLGPLQLRVEPPPPTPAPTPPLGGEGAVVESEDSGDHERDTAPRSNGNRGPSTWILVGAALLAGLVVGGGLAWSIVRRRTSLIPPRKRGQSPSERARVLHAALEQWWQGLPDSAREGELETEMTAIRRGLEGVRFAPGRADHTDTVHDLEKWMRRVMR